MAKSTSWQNVSSWYDKIVSKTGHVYHAEVVLPALFDLLELKKGDSLLDLGCGQGVVARALPPGVTYAGVDLAEDLLKKAKSYTKHPFHHHDLTEPFDLSSRFTHATFVLSLQNMERIDVPLQNAAKHLEENGSCVLILNHPCFRIPRQSSWGIDEKQKVQYRRIDRYMEHLKIPIDMHPSKKGKEMTYSFHHSLTDLSAAFLKAGFVIQEMRELCTHKESTGKHRKMENRAKREFPLFLACKLKKRMLP